MNERIKDLAEQAKGFVDLNQHIGGTNGCMVYTYDGLKGFAELIIQECADYIRENFDSSRAEPLAFCMERDFGLHGDYAE